MEVQKNIAKYDHNERPMILGIESSGSACSVGLAKGEDILGEYSIFGRNFHDEMLADLVRQLLIDCRVEVQSLDAVAVSAGPGSFTGLRIGSAVAKGICFDGAIKLVPVGTLHSIAFAYQNWAKRLKIKDLVVISRSHSEIYFLQKFGMEVGRIEEVELVSLEMIIEQSNLFELVLTTEGEISEKLPMCIYVLPVARNICLLGQKLFAEGKIVPAEDFVPEYHFEFIPKLVKK